MPLNAAKRLAQHAVAAAQGHVRGGWSEAERLRRQAEADALQQRLVAALGLSGGLAGRRQPALAVVRKVRPRG